jgi:UDP-N-acetylglucosamine acyltransferase
MAPCARKGSCSRRSSIARREDVVAVEIHPTAVVAAGAELADGVVVGPHAVVGDGVAIGPGTRLVASCVVLGPTRLGARNVVHPYAVLGAEPQDRSHAGEPTTLVVGDDNVFREHVTVHRGTAKDRGTTSIGSGCLFMVGAHVAHDVRVGDAVTLTNGTLVGGHAEIGDHVVAGGGSAIAPFSRVGESAFLAGNAMVENDVPPFVIAAGDRARVRALNEVGLRRRGVPEGSRRALAKAFRIVFRSGVPRAQALVTVQRELGADPWVARLVAFLEQPARRGGKRAR